MVEFSKRFSEERKRLEARKEFELWQQSHALEAKILLLLPEEKRHSFCLSNTRRSKLFNKARQARRSLGLRDELVPYVSVHPFILDEQLSKNPEIINSSDELKLIKEVNHGYWKKVGYFTPGLGKLLSPK